MCLLTSFKERRKELPLIRVTRKTKQNNRILSMNKGWRGKGCSLGDNNNIQMMEHTIWSIEKNDINSYMKCAYGEIIEFYYDIFSDFLFIHRFDWECNWKSLLTVLFTSGVDFLVKNVFECKYHEMMLSLIYTMSTIISIFALYRTKFKISMKNNIFLLEISFFHGNSIEMKKRMLVF